MAVRDYVKTIQDLEQLYYSNAGARFIQKDAPVISTTTGVYNAVYGAYVWAQINQEANAFGALPKVPWGRSGWRVITARSTTLGSIGVDENAALPATVKPTWAEISTKPKTVAINFDVSEVQEFLATNGGDDAIASMVDLRLYMGKEHREHINSMLLGDVGTTANLNFESIDRVCCSNSEVTGESLDTHDGDMYGGSNVNRDSSGWSDAQVDHNSGTDRAISDSQLRSLMSSTLKAGANPSGQFWLTGYDTFARIQGLYETQVRYNILGTAEKAMSVNGIATPTGVGVGMTLNTLYGRPVILSKDVVQDTISRVYLLDASNPEGYDLPRLCIKIAKPTQYFEAGMNVGDPFGINRLGNEGMYRTMGELICTFFACQGKIRDLK